MGCCSSTLCPQLPVEEAFPSLAAAVAAGLALPQLLPSGPADSDPSSASISLLLCGGNRMCRALVLPSVMLARNMFTTFPPALPL